MGCGGGGNKKESSGTEGNSGNIKSQIPTNSVSKFDCKSNTGLSFESGSDGDINIDCSSSVYSLKNGVSSLNITEAKTIFTTYNECDNGKEINIATMDYTKQEYTIYGKTSLSDDVMNCVMKFDNVLPHTITNKKSIEKLSTLFSENSFNYNYTSVSSGCSTNPLKVVSGNCNGIVKHDMVLKDSTGKTHKTTWKWTTLN